MDYMFLENYAVNYGVHAIVLSILICLLRLFLKKVFSGRINEVTRSYIEMAFSIISEFIITLISTGDLSLFTYKTVSSALLSYSLSLIIYSILSRIIKGKSLRVGAKALLIEGILENFVDEDKLTTVSKSVADFINEETSEEQLLPFLVDKLSRPTSEEELIALCSLILSSVKKVK